MGWSLFGVFPREKQYTTLELNKAQSDFKPLRDARYTDYKKSKRNKIDYEKLIRKLSKGKAKKKQIKKAYNYCKNLNNNILVHAGYHISSKEQYYGGHRKVDSKIEITDNNDLLAITFKPDVHFTDNTDGSRSRGWGNTNLCVGFDVRSMEARRNVY